MYLLLLGRVHGHYASRGVLQGLQLTATRADRLDFYNDTLAWLASNCVKDL